MVSCHRCHQRMDVPATAREGRYLCRPCRERALEGLSPVSEGLEALRRHAYRVARLSDGRVAYRPAERPGEVWVVDGYELAVLGRLSREDTALGLTVAHQLWAQRHGTWVPPTALPRNVRRELFG